MLQLQLSSFSPCFVAVAAIVPILVTSLLFVIVVEAVIVNAGGLIVVVFDVAAKHVVAVGALADVILDAVLPAPVAIVASCSLTRSRTRTRTRSCTPSRRCRRHGNYGYSCCDRSNCCCSLAAICHSSCA